MGVEAKVHDGPGLSWQVQPARTNGHYSVRVRACNAAAGCGDCNGSVTQAVDLAPVGGLVSSDHPSARSR